MGRKPNPLILEFFNRGAKLDDNSNRYKYDCKLCGSHFPRGRSNHLVSHLLTDCRLISADDRIKVSQHINSTNVGTISNAKNITNVVSHAYSAPSQRSPATCSSTRGDSCLTGLEALAEASRQVEYPKPNFGMIRVDANIDPDLEALGSAVGFGQLALPDPAPSLSYSGSDENVGSSLSGVRSLPIEDMASTFPLALANSNDLQGNLFDEPVPVSRARPSSSLPRIAKAATRLRTLAINRTPSRTPERGMATNRKVGKSRGRFSESRRKEISEMRKKGACIRCRMLRKICSEGDPCSSCSSIENARIWKQQCLRTRLSQEFTPFAAGLNANIAGRFLSSIVKEKQESVKVTICRDSTNEISMVFEAIVYSEVNTSKNMNSVPIPSQNTLMLVTPQDSVAKSLEEYAKELSPVLISREPSELTRISLMLGIERSSATNDILLSRVLQLWTLTQLLIEPKSSWKIQYGTRTGTDAAYTWETPVPQPNLLALDLQIRAAVESLATNTTKTVLQGLEQRLLQRPKCQSFETFLIAMILLNIVERTSWLFKSWQHPERYPDWPLKASPSSYAEQAQNFANLVTMLFNMRGVCVQVRKDPDTGYVRPAKENDPHIAVWFEAFNLTPSDLENCQNPVFDFNDLRSLDFSYAAKLLVMT